MITVKVCVDKQRWDDYVLEQGGHPLQLWSWGEVKAAHNWTVHRVFVMDGDGALGAAQLLVRHLPWPLRALVYIPRGPVVVPTARREVVLTELANYARIVFRAIVISVEPDWLQWPNLTDWRISQNTILIPRTLRLDLSKSEAELQAAMAKKTRQYIRKSAAEAIKIRQVKTHSELAECLAIYAETANRAGFAIHEDDYYYDIFDKMGEYAPLFMCVSAGHPVAFLWLAISETIAFELYGGMNDIGQELRANYALKWQTIKTIQKWGITTYDFNGLLNDGVSTFKRSFADHEDMLIGTYDKPLSPLYSVWSVGLPFAKTVIRKIKSLRK